MDHEETDTGEVGGRGSILINLVSKEWYRNEGTLTDPSWALLSSTL